MARTGWIFGLLAIGCALLMPLAAEAVSFVNSSGTFTAMQTPSDTVGTAFWNHHSTDGNGCNVGFVLEGGATVCGGTGLGLAQGQLQYLGDTTNPLAPAPFYFQSAIPNATFRFEKTAFTSDALYWYEIGNISNTGLIFTGGTAAGTVAVISGLPTNWGLKFHSQQPNDYFSNGSGTFNQFALFLSNGQYYAGMEDLSLGGTSDKDYNDMLVQFAPVPEPATMFLGGLGLIAFGYAARRRLFGR